MIAKIQLERNYDTLRYFLDCMTLLYGQMGTGKTTNAVAMAYWMREMFGRPVICVGTTLGIKPPFGDYSYLTVKEFIEQFLLIDKISNEVREEQISEQDLPRFLKFCQETRGLKLYNCILVVDEMYKYADAHRSSSPLTLAITNFVDQMRHYHCAWIGMTPTIGRITNRLRDQIRWRCKPDEGPDRVYHLRFVGPHGVKVLTINGPDYAGKYPGDPEAMFDSWAFTGFNAKGLEKVLEKYV